MERAGTVAVTGANGLVGRELLARLAGRVRTVALVRRPVALPADRVIPDWMATGEATATAALREAGVVVHLCGEISARGAAGYDAANVAPARVVAGAARAGQRVLFISYPGADLAAGNSPSPVTPSAAPLPAP